MLFKCYDLEIVSYIMFAFQPHSYNLIFQVIFIKLGMVLNTRITGVKIGKALSHGAYLLMQLRNNIQVKQ